MFGNVTALEGLHVAGKYRNRSKQHTAHMLHACGLRSLQIMSHMECRVLPCTRDTDQARGCASAPLV